MAPFAFTDASIYVDGHDFTADTNNAMLDMTANELDVTTFRSKGWKECVAGVKAVAFQEEGFWQAGTGQLDPEVFPNLGGTKVFTLAPIETNTSVAYLWRGGEFHYEPMRGAHGDAAGFLLSSVGKDGVGAIRGKLAVKMATVTATGPQGSSVNIVTTSASGYVYASVHAFAVGTSMSAVVESATESTFASPTTQGSFTITSAGGNWMTRVAATSGQHHYRFRVVAMSGASESFTIASAIGVQ